MLRHWQHSGLAAHDSAPAVPFTTSVTSATPVDPWAEFSFAGHSFEDAAAAPATSEPTGAVASSSMQQSTQSVSAAC